jgi:hypothetical protein
VNHSPVGVGFCLRVCKKEGKFNQHEICGNLFLYISELNLFLL